jgi:hypothetical protein
VVRSSSWNGSTAAAESTVSSVAAISISPVPRSGFTVSALRARTVPVIAMQYSERSDPTTSSSVVPSPGLNTT